MDHKLYALAIVAHPDDESYLMSGLALKLAEKKLGLGLICATRGEKGNSKLPYPISSKQLGLVRENELRKAAKIFKAKPVEFLHYIDGELCFADFHRLSSRLAAKIDHYKPQLIISFGKEGISGHKDHIIIGKAAVQAAKLAKHHPGEIWLASRPRSQMKLWNDYVKKMRVHHSHFRQGKLKGVPDKLLRKINITKYKNKKLKSIYCHKSQGLPAWMRLGFTKLTKSMLHYEFFEVIKLNQSALTDRVYTAKIAKIRLTDRSKTK